MRGNQRTNLAISIWSCVALISFALQTHAGMQPKITNPAVCPCPSHPEQFHSYLMCLPERGSILTKEIPDLARDCYNSKPEFKTVVPNIDACLQRSERFSKRQGLSPNSFGMSFDEYTRLSEKPTEVPKDLLTPEFLALTRKVPPDPAALEKLMSKMNSGKSEENKLRAFYFDSHSKVPAPGNGSIGRLFVFVPGNPRKFIAFGTPNAKFTPSKISDNVSVVAVDRQIDRDTFYIVDKQMIESSGQVQLSRRLGKSQSCYECHKSGPIPIYPEKYSPLNLPPDIEYVNQQMQMKNPTPAGNLNLSDYGPGFGDKSRVSQLPDDFFGRCLDSSLRVSPEVLTQQAKRFRDLMSCSNCHSGTKRGVLNELKESSSTSNLVQHFIDNNLMPPDESLSRVEKRSLFVCLSSEYRQAWTEWLFAEGCGEAKTILPVGNPAGAPSSAR